MALQSQTYANSGNAYYITGADPINPSTNTALYGPVEILFTSSIQGPYHAELNQGFSNFTISENNSNLSTINSLVMDPNVPKTTMNIYNYTTNAEPVIQQWTNTSSIVNGIFKVGNKQLNDEPGALIFQNGVPQSGVTRIDAGTTQTFIDGVNNRTRFTNQADNTWNVSINQNPVDASVSVNSPGDNSIVTQPTVQTFNRNNITYGRTGVNSGGINQYYMSARTQMDFVTDEINVAPTVLSLKQDATAVFISTVFAPTVSSITVNTVNLLATNANLDTISTFRINQKGPSGQPIFVAGSVELRRIPGPNGVAGANALTSPRVIINDSGVTPKVYFPPTDNQAQFQQGTIGGSAGGPPFAPATATNSLEIVASSALTEGGVQFYNAKSGTAPPEWMGGFLKNPKSFNVAPGYTANLLGTVSTTSLFANTAISTPVVRVSNFINVNESGYINVGSNGYISTPTLNATSNVLTNFLTATSSMKSAIVTVTNANSSQFALYPNQYGNFQGQLIYNTLRDNRGAPATSYESLEIVNVSGGPQTGGIQFYTSDNSNPNFPKWMGGFLQNNVGAGQSEFRLASTVTASLPQLRDVSTINTLPIASFGVPVGTMLNWAGQNPASVPSGFLLCDGSQYPIAGTYNNLYNTIGSWDTDVPVTPGNFRLPDSRGKVSMGSLTSPGTTGPAGAYSVTANFISLITITLPTSWGSPSPTRVGMIVENPTGQIYERMAITAPFQLGTQIQAFINSDGLFGNRRISTGPAERRNIILFTNDVVLVGPAPATVTFVTEAFYNRFYPFIGESWNNTTLPLGAGNMYALQQSYEVGAHNHTSQQPGGGASALGGGIRAGDPNISGPPTSINNNIFSYVDPATTLTVQAPQAIYTLPYNFATWQIIKF